MISKAKMAAYCDYGGWRRTVDHGKRESDCTNEAALIVGYVSGGRCQSVKAVCLGHSDAAFINSFSGAVAVSLELNRWDWLDGRVVAHWRAALARMAQARREDEEQEIDGEDADLHRATIEAFMAAGKEAMVDMIAAVYP